MHGLVPRGSFSRFSSSHVILKKNFSPSFTSSFPHSTCTRPSTSSPMSTTSREITASPSHIEEYCPVATYHPPTGYEPNVLDDFHYLKTSAMIFQDESGDVDTEPSFLCDAELDDETIRKASFSPLFIQKRQESANWRQVQHSHEASLLPAQSFFAHTRTGGLVHELSSCQKRKTSREMENERIRILSLNDKKSILDVFGAEIHKHEFQADSDGEVSRN